MTKLRIFLVAFVFLSLTCISGESPVPQNNGNLKLYVSTKNVNDNLCKNHNVDITEDGAIDRASIKVTPKIIYFVPKNDTRFWPKASGMSITKDDFNINLHPRDATWTLATPSGAPQLAPRVTQTYTATAVATQNGNSSAEEQCQYTIMGPGEWWEPFPNVTIVNESFTDAKICTSTYLELLLGIFKYELRNGSIKGSGTYTVKDATGWSSLGGPLPATASTSYTDSRKIGKTWEAAMAQVSFSYSTTMSATFEHLGISEFRIAMKGLKQIIPTVTSGTVNARRTTIPWINYDSGWVAVSPPVAFPNENNTGNGEPVIIVGKKYP